jgi:intein/homing endonuclease
MIETENGKNIKCTPNHTFLTADKKWKRYSYREGEERLKLGDSLQHYQNNTFRISSLKMKDV